MPRGDGTGPRGMGAGTGRGLGGCKPRGTGAATDRGPGFLRTEMDSGLGSEDRLTGRGRSIGTMVVDLLFALFERATRK